MKDDRSRDQSDRPTIMVADSEVLIRHAIADYLRKCGFAVVEAATTDEAIAVLEERTLRVVALLCNVKAAGSLSAFQLRAWTQEHRPEVRCVLAGNPEQAARAAAEICDDGPQAGRPFDPQAVVDHIKRMLANRHRGSVQADPARPDEQFEAVSIRIR